VTSRIYFTFSIQRASTDKFEISPCDRERKPRGGAGKGRIRMWGTTQGTREEKSSGKTPVERRRRWIPHVSRVGVSIFLRPFLVD
jgi:hypothetical protein